MRLRILALGLLLFGGVALAQAPAPVPALPGATAPRPQTPPRDSQTPQGQTGTAVIKGRITAADTGRPLRRAHISVAAPELGRQNRDVSTDVDGHYEIKDLPAARYTLTVTRSGYLQLRYGQRHAMEQGKPLDVANGQVIQNIDFALPRMGVIAGRVMDELGDPIDGANVFAMRLEYWNGRRQIVLGGQIARTDDAGQYRLTGLMPGTYWVQAKLRETWTVTENGTTEQLGYAPTFLPGATNFGEAERITVGIGQQVSVSDVSLVPGRAAKVSGIALDAAGRPLAGGGVNLTDQTSGPGGAMMMSAGSSPVAADGTFVIANVQPGEYRIGASTPANRQPGAAPEAVTRILTMNGQDVEGLQLVTTAGWSISGRLRAEFGENLTADRSRVSIAASAVSPEFGGRPTGVATSSQIHDDWTFAMTNIFGASRLQVSTPTGWALKSVLQGNRDISDAPLDLKSGEELSGLEIVLTNRVTRVSGQITDQKDAVADGTVILFASDSDKWFDRSRWIRAARPDQQGRFEVTGLPAGEYLAIALDYVQDGVWNDPEYLAPLVRQAQKVTLKDDGQSVTVPLKLATAPQ